MNKGRVIGIVVTLCLMSQYGVQRIKKFYSHPTFFTLFHPESLSCLSADCCFDLQSFLSQQKTTFSNAFCCKKVVLEQFPALKKIVMRYKQGVFVADVTVARPLALFNDQYVLTDTNRLVDSSFWNGSVLEKIPHLTVASCAELTEENKLFLKNISREVQGLYQVEWIDESFVKFRDARYPRITLLGSCSTNSDLLLHYVCADLKEEIVKKETSKRKSDWYIDLRFKNQIIVFRG